MDWTQGLVIVVGIIALTAIIITLLNRDSNKIIMQLEAEVGNLKLDLKKRDDWTSTVVKSAQDQAAIWKERGDRLSVSHDQMQDAQKELYKELTGMVAKAGNHAGFKDAVGQLLPNGVPGGNSGTIVDVNR